jgi:hypothetical protein
MEVFMMLKRIRIDIAIPEAVYAAIPAATKLAFRDQVRAMKAKAVRINEGAANEEVTIKATIHDCYHDENTNKPCGAEIDF